ncbi:MAG: DUF4160 domain-containing protein [Candidatus Omnitrophica bacterium]|nr:DUF4160 domain-containing protein [Candidatus Omnitrophota bacterium]
MPTIFIIQGYRFFFFSNEGTEPIHVHVEKGGKYAKFWIEPLSLVRNSKFNSSELNKIREIIVKNKRVIEERWNEHFGIDRG